MTGRFYVPLLLGGLLAAWSSVSQADIVVYGDMEGDYVLFNNITEISVDPLPIFGMPTVSDDTLEFPAPGFIAQSQSGGVDFLNGRIRFTVEAKPGFLIESISVDQFGSYFTFGADSNAFVGGTAFVQIGNTLFPGASSFSTSGNSNGGWTDGFVINFPAAPKVTFVMDNTLFTLADASDASFIDIQGVNISVGSFSTVPEPSTAAGLLVFGSLAGLVMMRRRPRRVALERRVSRARVY